jgi:phosphoribosylformylglycinamidine cyclo-ligase
VKTTYRDAGVDIDAGVELIERIKPHVRRTFRPEVIGDLGGFGGLFSMPKGYTDPVLVSGTDGVGTKLKIAFLTGRHDTVGIDLVAMCVNDIAVTGAEPLFFLDYFASGRLEVAVGEAVVKGIADGCRQAGCALIGGETAELPGFYAPREYDLAGFAVGCVEKSRIVDGRTVAPGDVVLGLASSGLHSNGYSLARKALLDHHPLDARLPDLAGRTVAEALLEPTRIYARDVLALLEKVRVKALAHVTGGGLPGNVPRSLPDGTKAVLDERRWPRPPIFDLVQRAGAVPREEMFRTFNMGLGLVAVLPPSDVTAAQELLSARGLASFAVGAIERCEGEATCEVVR